MADYNFASTSMLLRAYAVGDAFNGAVVIACLYICHDGWLIFIPKQNKYNGE